MVRKVLILSKKPGGLSRQGRMWRNTLSRSKPISWLQVISLSIVLVSKVSGCHISSWFTAVEGMKLAPAFQFWALNICQALSTDHCGVAKEMDKSRRKEIIFGICINDPVLLIDGPNQIIWVDQDNLPYCMNQGIIKLQQIKYTMDEDDYDMQFDEQEPVQRSPVKSSATKVISSLNPQQLHSSKYKSESKFSINEPLPPRSILTDKWKTHSSKALSTNHLSTAQQQFIVLTQDQLRRENLQLQIKIKALSKQLQQQGKHPAPPSLERTSLQTSKLTLTSQHTTTTHTLKLTREFNLDSYVSHLHSKHHQGIQMLTQQSNQILKLKNRELELTSERYLLDVAKKCEEYEKYIKRLKKYVVQERHLLEGGKKEGQEVQEHRQHRNSHIRSVRLYREMELEKMQDKEGELDDKIHEAIQKNQEAEETIKELEEYVEPDDKPVNPLASKAKHLRKQIENLHKNIKVLKSSSKNKIYILTKEKEQLQQSLKRMNRQEDDQDASNYSMLERLKKYLEEVEDQQVLNLGNCLLSQLESFHKKPVAKTMHTVDSKSNLGEQSQNFTRGIIRLKRRVAAASQKKHEQTLMDIYKSQSPIITQFPSLIPSSKNIHLPKKRPNSLLSLTMVDKNNTTEQHVKFSYW